MIVGDNKVGVLVKFILTVVVDGIEADIYTSLVKVKEDIRDLIVV